MIAKFITDHQQSNKIHLIRRTLPNAQTGKGDALNYGLNYIRQQTPAGGDNVIGVLDADAVMKQVDFQKVLYRFASDPQLALLQTKVRMLNANNWLQKMQDIEFATVNDWIQRIRNKIHDAAASGNGQFIRMNAIKEQAAPWGNALLEDFEFSTNFLLQGKKTLYCSDIVVYQEAVNKLVSFIRQRFRWTQGGLDCIGKYLKKIIHSSQIKLSAKVEMTYFMFLPFFTLLVGFSNLLTFIFALERINAFVNLFIFLIDANCFLALYMSIKFSSDVKKVKLRTIIECLGMNVYNLILFPSVVIALYRKITKKQKWIKTAHGQN